MDLLNRNKYRKVKAITLKTKKDMVQELNIKKIQDNIYRDARQSDQDWSVEAIDNDRSRIFAPLGQQNRQASVGSAFLGTADHGRNDHLVQQQCAMAIVDDEALPLLSLRPDLHDSICY